ncbi:hypothetical protein GOODEAATRI_030572 [Goodea atripinnis]|uniref:Uncharacterized protein n=1 Tax=Goodea atripinnis TaxID=208336 RepID=A0ABV0NPE9_9TELE
MVLVLASESNDEGFQDETLPDPVPEGFMVEPLSGHVPGFTTKGSASASKSSPGTVSPSEGSPGTVSAGHPDSCSAAAGRPGLHASASLLVFAIVAVACCPGSYVSADLLVFTFIAATGCTGLYGVGPGSHLNFVSAQDVLPATRLNFMPAPELCFCFLFCFWPVFGGRLRTPCMGCFWFLFL